MDRDQDDREPSSAHARHEDGFTLIELMVVLLIVGILMVVAIWGVASARSAGRIVGAMSVAQAYADAADDFARDHAGRYPRAPGAPGSTDWSASPGLVGRGPIDPAMGAQGRYLRRIPEPIQDGSITFGTSTAAAAASLRYVHMGPSATRPEGYRIELRVRNRPACAVYGGVATPVAGMPRCSER